MEPPADATVVNSSAMDVDQDKEQQPPSDTPTPPGTSSTPPASSPSVDGTGSRSSGEESLQARFQKFISKRPASDSGNGSESNKNVKNLDGTYNAILTSRVHSLNCRDLNGSNVAKNSVNLGSFFGNNDHRISTCTVRSVYVTKQNLSYSFDPRTFICRACAVEHTIVGDRDDRSGPIVFVITDQCFPPAMGSTTGSGCVKIIRLENGRLFEMARAFVDLMTGVSLPVGSLVMISSASHLADVGLGAYAEEFSRCSKFLLHSFTNKIDVRHGISVLLGGCDAAHLVRALAELDAWLASLSDQDSFPVDARRAALLALKNSGRGLQPVYSLRHRLPISLSNVEKTTWHSSGWADLPVTVAPLDSNAEKDILDTFIVEINSKYSLNLDPCINLDRSPPRQAATSMLAAPTYVVVGASNAARLTTVLQESGATVHHVMVPSWLPNQTIIKEACESLSKIPIEDVENSVIIMFNLDSSAFKAATSEGDLIPAKQIEGKYHIDGDLVVTPKELFQKSLKICVPLLQQHPDVKKIILSPLPRYWLAKCCSDEEHIPNFGTAEYEEELFEGIANLRRVTKDFLFLQHIPNVKVINPFLVFAGSSGRNISQEAIEAVREMWGPDPVHPSLDCIDRLAAHLQNLATGEDTESSASSTTSTCVQPKSKRLRWACETPSAFVTPCSARSRGSGWQGGWNRPRGRGGRGGGRGRGWPRGGHRY
jgi:hypothetical protein